MGWPGEGFTRHPTYANALMENWNQEQPKRNCHFHGMYIKHQGHGKVRATESGQKHYFYSKKHV